MTGFEWNGIEWALECTQRYKNNLSTTRLSLYRSLAAQCTRGSQLGLRKYCVACVVHSKSLPPGLYSFSYLRRSPCTWTSLSVAILVPFITVLHHLKLSHASFPQPSPLSPLVLPPRITSHQSTAGPKVLSKQSPKGKRTHIWPTLALQSSWQCPPFIVGHSTTAVIAQADPSHFSNPGCLDL